MRTLRKVNVLMKKKKRKHNLAHSSMISLSLSHMHSIMAPANISLVAFMEQLSLTASL